MVRESAYNGAEEVTGGKVAFVRPDIRVVYISDTDSMP